MFGYREYRSLAASHIVRYPECGGWQAWRGSRRAMWRCTRCGHRVRTNGKEPVETRYRPWRIPAEIIGRYRARRHQLKVAL